MEKINAEDLIQKKGKNNKMVDKEGKKDKFAKFSQNKRRRFDSEDRREQEEKKYKVSLKQSGTVGTGI